MRKASRRRSEVRGAAADRGLGLREEEELNERRDVSVDVRETGGRGRRRGVVRYCPGAGRAGSREDKAAG
jgi:hypothetical protein